jgi:hypothetical protein
MVPGERNEGTRGPAGLRVWHHILTAQIGHNRIRCAEVKETASGNVLVASSFIIPGERGNRIEKEKVRCPLFCSSRADRNPYCLCIDKYPLKYQ